jgi:uncharacterized membrane protein
MPIQIVIISTLAALVQVAALMLLIRGAMWLSGPTARNNFVYGLFTVGAMPFIHFTRAVMQRAVPDRYIPAIAFLLVFALWVALALTQQTLCARPGVQCG